MDTAHPPLVLVLNVGGIRPLDDDKGEQVVRAKADMLGQVKLGGQAAVLAHAQQLAVQVNIKDALGPANLQMNAAVFPRGRNLDGFPVNTGRILVRYFRRIQVERHLNVRVMGMPVAVQRPVGGYRNGPPAAPGR